MKENTTDIFENAPIPKAVISNVIPSIISMLMVLVYNLADTLFIGMTKNELMVAGVSVATPVFLLFMSVGMLFGIGGMSLIARLLGRGSTEDAKHTSSFCFWTGSLIGIIAAVFVMIFAEPISLMIGASKDTTGYVSQYLRIVSVGIPFLIVSNAFSNIIRAEGNAKTAMMGMIIGNMANVVLDPIMILALGWNVAGAAWATVLGNVFSAVIYIYHMVKKSQLLSISPKEYKPVNGIVAGVMMIGVPASLNSVLLSLSNILVNKQMEKFGDMAVAGLGVAMKVNMIVVMLLIGLGLGIQPLLGYCFGSGNRKRYFGVLKFSIMLALGISLVMTAICFLGAKPIVRLVLEKPEAYEFGIKFAKIYIISGPVMGILFVFINAIQSMGAAVPALILNVSRQGLIYIPILSIFSSVFNSSTALAAAQPVSDYLSSTLAVVLFIIFNKKYFSRQAEKIKKTENL